MAKLDIVEWAEGSQRARGFYVDRHYDSVAGRWVMQPGPIRLAEYHRDILSHIFTPAAGRWPYTTVAWCEPAKSGKSAIAGLCAQYAALAETNSTVVMAANKQNQARSVMYKSITDSLTLNPALRRLVDPKSTEVVLNGTTVRAIPSNSRGEAGARFSLALFDELWAYVYEDARRLWSEFKPDPTRLNSMRFAIGYAGYLESELWLNLLQTGLKGEPVPELSHIRNPDGEPACWRNRSHFTFWSHQPRQPWQTDKWLSSLNLSDSEYSRMIDCVFVEGIGNFCTPMEWAALIDPNHTPLPPGSRQPVYVGMDIATAQNGDDCALIGVYLDEARLKVAFHKVWRAKDRTAELKLDQTVKPHLLRLRELYNLRGVYFDPFQAKLLAEQLRADGITCIEIQQNRASRGPNDTRLQEMVHNRELVLYPDPDLEKASAGANAYELGNGQIFIKKSSRLKIDLLIALSNVASQPLLASTVEVMGLAEFLRRREPITDRF